MRVPSIARQRQAFVRARWTGGIVPIRRMCGMASTPQLRVEAAGCCKGGALVPPEDKRIQVEPLPYVMDEGSFGTLKAPLGGRDRTAWQLVATYGACIMHVAELPLLWEA